MSLMGKKTKTSRGWESKNFACCGAAAPGPCWFFFLTCAYIDTWSTGADWDENKNAAGLGIKKVARAAAARHRAHTGLFFLMQNRAAACA
jgi:hypothetical protein